MAAAWARHRPSCQPAAAPAPNQAARPLGLAWPMGAHPSTRPASRLWLQRSIPGSSATSPPWSSPKLLDTTCPSAQSRSSESKPSCPPRAAAPCAAVSSMAPRAKATRARSSPAAGPAWQQAVCVGWFGRGAGPCAGPCTAAAGCVAGCGRPNACMHCQTPAPPPLPPPPRACKKGRTDLHNPWGSQAAWEAGQCAQAHPGQPHSVKN